MKRIAIACLFLASVLVAQSPAPKPEPPKPLPVLSTAEKVSLQSIAQKQQDLYQQNQGLERERRQIMGEFQQNHPGYHLDEQTYAVVADAKPAPTKEAPKAEKPKDPIAEQTPAGNGKVK